MSHLSNNFRLLRKRKDLTQMELAEKLGVKRASIGSYEEDRSEPRLETITKACDFFNVSIDDLVNKDLSKVSENEVVIDNNKLRILTIAVDNENEELITFVPIKASAGYLTGYGDIEFIGELPKFRLPFTELSREKTYRAFEIAGDSMLPISSGSYIICEYVTEIKNLKSGYCYVLVSKDEGIVYKRVVNRINETKEFLLKSDNKEYEPYSVDAKSITEAWKAVGYVSFELPTENNMSINELSNIVMNLQNQLKNS